MNKILTRHFYTTNFKVALILTTLVLGFVILTLAQDFLRADLKDSTFYFSESLMFSSFWWLYAPLLFAQYFVVTHKVEKKFKAQAALIIFPVCLHLFAFPFIVWLLSKIFYYHTYSVQQTFKYTLSEHLYPLLLFYSIPALVFQYLSKKSGPVNKVAEKGNESAVKQFNNYIIISEGNKKQSIIVSDIMYFSAVTPYINLHLENKKYLHNETLKSILIKLNPADFVRVHKSTIVNINMVTSYTTRLNGDYDLTMKNNVQLRVSRNYAADFKTLFNKVYHFTTR